jgi:hypothetical protein
MRGAALIKDLNVINVFSRILQLSLTVIFLFCNLGLYGLLIANLIYPFLSRFLITRVLLKNELFCNTNLNNVEKADILNMTKIVWHNSKKLGLVFLGSFLINKIGFLIAGFFLNLDEIASFGLMEQFFGIIISLSANYFNTNLPMFSFYRVNRDENNSIKLFSNSILIFYILYFFGFLLIIFLSPVILSLIDSKVQLPSNIIVIAYFLVVLLEQNHSLFATYITTKNVVPFLIPSLLSGIFICLGVYFWFVFISKNIIGLILVPGIIQLFYNNWKWPNVVFKEFNLTATIFYKNLFGHFKDKIKILFYG